MGFGLLGYAAGGALQGAGKGLMEQAKARREEKLRMLEMNMRQQDRRDTRDYRERSLDLREKELEADKEYKKGVLETKKRDPGNLKKVWDEEQGGYVWTSERDAIGKPAGDASNDRTNMTIKLFESMKEDIGDSRSDEEKMEAAERMVDNLVGRRKATPAGQGTTDQAGQAATESGSAPNASRPGSANTLPMSGGKIDPSALREGQLYQHPTAGLLRYLGNGEFEAAK